MFWRERDDQLLASGGKDHTIRLWEVSTGREVAVWHAHEGGVTALAFRPDGRTLASAGRDGLLRLWDLPLIDRELSALGLGWTFKGTKPWEVKSLAQRTEAKREGYALAERLWAKLLSKEEVLEALRQEKNVGEEVRRLAQEVINAGEEIADELEWRAQCAVYSAGDPPGKYQQALRWAERGCYLAEKKDLADRRSFVTIKGIAQYRLGQYPEALQALNSPDLLGISRSTANQAFLAMTQFRLGHKEQAGTTLSGLRETVKKLKERFDRETPEAEWLLRQAEEVIEGEGTKEETAFFPDRVAGPLAALALPQREVVSGTAARKLLWF